MHLSDLRLKVFLCFLLAFLYLQLFSNFDMTRNRVLLASKSSVKSFTSKFHFFSAFSSGPGRVTILLLAHNSVKVGFSNYLKCNNSKHPSIDILLLEFPCPSIGSSRKCTVSSINAPLMWIVYIYIYALSMYAKSGQKDINILLSPSGDLGIGLV